jgi:tripartite-type tricarboxylate transporter receptor subunit TctC
MIEHRYRHLRSIPGRLAVSGSATLPRAPVLAACGSRGTSAGASPSAEPSISYPTQPIILAVPAPAGSSLDIEERQLAEDLGQQLGQSVAVLDDPGAKSAIGIADVPSKPAAGHTLPYEADGTMADLIAQGLIPCTFTGISPVVQSDGEAVGPITASSSPFKPVNQVVACAKAPPDQLPVAPTGTAGPDHVAYLALEKYAAITLKRGASRDGAKTATVALIPLPK